MKPKYIIELNKKLKELKEPYVIENEKKECIFFSLTDDGKIRISLGYDGVEKKPKEEIIFHPKVVKEIFATLLQLIGETEK